METTPTTDSAIRSCPFGPDDAQSVLAHARHQVDDSDAVCGRLLGVDEPTATNYLAVAIDRSADECLDHWRGHVDPELPAKTGIVSVGEITRGAAAADTAPVAIPGCNVHVAAVSSPGDLTGIGIAIDRFLSAWDDDNQTVVCIDSVTTLLQFVDTRRTFRFLNTILTRFASVNATVHAHVNPEAHDDQTLAIIGCAFDVIVERDADCEWSGQ